MKVWKPALTAVLLISSTANAALHERLGGLAYYDDQANLTWLQDANYAKTSGYNTDGGMIVGEGQIWVSSLNIAGVTGWRLPTAPDIDPSCDAFYNNCTGSELGNLYYNVFGGIAGEYLGTTHNANFDLFSNVINIIWGTPSAAFSMYDGHQLGDDPTVHKYNIWPVQTGDVALKLIDDDADDYVVGIDCDDTNASIYPGAAETNDDGIDSNCDGLDNRTDIGLHPRLSGQVVYHADRDISWLGNMNLAITNSFGVAGIEADGRMTWDIANLWVDAMNANAYLGFSDWQLPEAFNITPDPLCNGDTDCDAGDMGHLYYLEFNYSKGDETNTGGLPGCTQCLPDSDVSLFSPFKNTYWTNSARDVSGMILIDEFHFNGFDAGATTNNGLLGLNHVTAVRPGDTPEMFISQQQINLNGSIFTGLGSFITTHSTALITPDSIQGSAGSSSEMSGSGTVNFELLEPGVFVYKVYAGINYGFGILDAAQLSSSSYVIFSCPINDVNYECGGKPVIVNLEAGSYTLNYTASGFMEPLGWVGGSADVSLERIIDKDRDGYYDYAGFTLSDCNDNDFFINSGANDIPGDGIDQNCDGADAVDFDGDGFDNIADCNDNDASVYPGATETNNDGIDSNCDDLDNADTDKDGFDIFLDCNDSDTYIHPDAREIDNDGVDSNCDGLDYNDRDKDGFDNVLDCNDFNASIYPGAIEVISDGIDQDCNAYDLTITVSSAVYSSKRQTLTVEASSALGKSAQLVLDGYGSMSYSKRKNAWSKKIRKISNAPTSISVSGIEGTVSAQVIIQ